MILFNFLNKPYPYEESVIKRLFICTLFGVFIGLFLFAFEPFGLSDIDHGNKGIFIWGYGLVTFFSLLITMLLIPYIFKSYYYTEKWTAGREILHISITMLLITILNIFYSIIFCENCEPFHEDIIKVLIFSFFSVILVGLIPVTFMVIIYQNILLKKHIKNAESVNQNLSSVKQTPKAITIYSNNKKNLLNVNSSQLLAIEANGNYINVYYEEKEKLNREVIRNTLKKTEVIVENHSNFIRCHKSYIVNLSKLQKVTGNAQGYKLVFDFLDFEIPISRSLSKLVLEKIQN